MAALAAGTLMFCLQAQTSLQEFTEKAKAQGATPVEIINFLHKNQYDQTLCKSIGVVFEIWHDNLYNKELWRRIAGQFFDLAMRCQQSEGDLEDERWLEALGPSFRQMYGYVKDRMGIHGNISVSTELDKIRFEIATYHDETYDEAAWQSIIDLLILTIEQGSKNSEKENIIWLQKLMPIIGNAVSDAGDESGLHGVLDAKVNDTTNYVGISYTA